MPLPTFGSPVYLNRRRVYLDSDEKDQEGQTHWDGRYSIGTELRDVIGMELVGYNFRREIAPTFVKEKRLPDGTFQRGNNILDIRVTDIPVTQSLTFSVEFEEGSLRFESDAYNALADRLNTALDAQGDPVFNTANNYTFGATGIAALNTHYQAFQGTWWVVAFRFMGDATLASSEYLFGSGENAENSAWRVFGFEEGKDVGGPTFTAPGFTFDPIPVRALDFRPYTYVDVVVDEAQNRNPLSRIFLYGDAVTNTYTTESTQIAEYQISAQGSLRPRVRLFNSQPLRNLSDITVHIVFKDGIQPPTSHDLPYDLIIDILYLTPQAELPEWVKQAFGF